MPLAFYDMEIVRGDTFGETWTLLNDDETPVNLTGCSIAMDIRLDVDSPDRIDRFTSSGGGFIITDPTNGVFTLSISSYKTALYDFETAIYDLEITDLQGQVITLLRGTVFLLKDITRA